MATPSPEDRGSPEETSVHPAKRHKTSPRSTAPHYGSYTVAWVCALFTELAAARAMLDETYRKPPAPMPIDDSNTYHFGRIKEHFVVIACLPDSQYGTNNAVNVLTHMRRTFPALRVALMVGIGGGTPHKADIRLGDVVVGTRVMQYDLGKVVNLGELKRTATPRHVSLSIATSLSSLRSDHELQPSRVPIIINKALERLPKYGRPDTPDRMFLASYRHEDEVLDCNTCDVSKLIPRIKRKSDDPVIHYGAIASGNQVMKDACSRDLIARELDIMCFEMEAAGIVDVLPCLPVRGICDYSDSHKSKEWQKFAAITAVAFAKEFLEFFSTAEPRSHVLPEADTVMSDTAQAKKNRDDYRGRLLDSLRFDQLESRKDSIEHAHSKTCEWLLSHSDYQAWLDPRKMSQHNGFLWMNGKAGAGKSTILKFAYQNMNKNVHRQHGLLASFYFHARGVDLERSVTGMYRSLLLQLLQGYTDLQDILDDSTRAYEMKVHCPSLNVLKALFNKAVVALGPRSFTCFIDALDECDEQQVVEMVRCFEELAEEAANEGATFRVFFSSRPYPYISLRRGLRFTLENQAGHGADMESYVGSRLEIQDPTLLEELRSEILGKAAGIFLWAVLVVGILNKENRRGRFAIRKRLAQVPSGLSELFHSIIHRDQEDAEQLRLCIFWLLYAARPLSPEEYYHALWSGLSLKNLADPIPAVNAPDIVDVIFQSIISSSKGLAEISKSHPPVVQFIDESVRDYLLKDNGLSDMWPELGFDPTSQGHEVIKQCCYAYMREPGVQAIVRKAQGYNDETWFSLLTIPLKQYAFKYILHHANAAAEMVPQRRFLSQLDASGFIRCLESNDHPYHPCTSLTYVLADWGYSALIRELSQPEHRACERDLYRYPCFMAWVSGHRDSFAAILGLPSGACNGIENYIADSHLWSSRLRSIIEPTDILWACTNGHWEIVKLLLIVGISPNKPDDEGRTPLFCAVLNDKLSIVELLLEYGAEINGSLPNNECLLTHVIRHGKADMAAVLIQWGANANPHYLNGTAASLLRSARVCRREVISQQWTEE